MYKWCLELQRYGSIFVAAKPSKKGKFTVSQVYNVIIIANYCELLQTISYYKCFFLFWGSDRIHSDVNEYIKMEHIINSKRIV